MEAENKIKLLKDELRNEEMKLVLLKKLRQSQQMKENISIVPINNANTSQPVPPSTHPVSSKLSSTNTAHRSSSAHHKPPTTPPVPPLLRGVSYQVSYQFSFLNTCKRTWTRSRRSNEIDAIRNYFFTRNYLRCEIFRRRKPNLSKRSYQLPVGGNSKMENAF